MTAIKQIIEVKNHSFTISLPADFHAKRVEVIILAADQELDDIPQWQKDIVLNRIKNPQTPVDAFEMLNDIDEK